LTDFTHFNEAGEAHMLDVGAKPVSERRAVAEIYIEMQPDTLALILSGGHKKGDALGIARIMASKRTADLIPFCHPMPRTHVEIKLEAKAEHLKVRCEVTVKTTWLERREIQNRLAHEYPDAAALRFANLIAAIKAADALVANYRQWREKMRLSLSLRPKIQSRILGLDPFLDPN
jgi:cyclic pyranopterin phosphate synthase